MAEDTGAYGGVQSSPGGTGGANSPGVTGGNVNAPGGTGTGSQYSGGKSGTGGTSGGGAPGQGGYSGGTSGAGGYGGSSNIGTSSGGTGGISGGGGANTAANGPAGGGGGGGGGGAGAGGSAGTGGGAGGTAGGGGGAVAGKPGGNAGNPGQRTGNQISGSVNVSKSAQAKAGKPGGNAANPNQRTTNQIGPSVPVTGGTKAVKGTGTRYSGGKSGTGGTLGTNGQGGTSGASLSPSGNVVNQGVGQYSGVGRGPVSRGNTGAGAQASGGYSGGVGNQGGAIANRGGGAPEFGNQGDQYNDARAAFGASLPGFSDRDAAVLASAIFGGGGPRVIDPSSGFPQDLGQVTQPEAIPAHSYSLNMTDPNVIAAMNAARVRSVVDPWGAGQPTTLGPTPGAPIYGGPDVMHPGPGLAFSGHPNPGYSVGPVADIPGGPAPGGVLPGSGGYRGGVPDDINDPTGMLNFGHGPITSPPSGSGQVAGGPPAPSGAPGYHTGTGPDISPGQLAGPQVVHGYGPGVPTAGGNTIVGPGYGHVALGGGTTGPTRGDFQGPPGSPAGSVQHQNGNQGGRGVTISPAGGHVAPQDMGGYRDIMNPTPAPGYSGNPRMGDPAYLHYARQQIFGNNTVPYRR